MGDKELYERVGSRIGWNFSQITPRVTAVGRRWNYQDVVKQYLSKNDVLLDIGTGGGEKLLLLSKYMTAAYGIDNSKSMIATAKRNVKKKKVKNVRLTLASSSHLPFSQGFFDVVICRHAPFISKELARVTKCGGIFITQQVGENDKINIKRIFGRGQSYGVKAGTGMNKYVRQLKDAGFTIIRKSTYNATEYYDSGALLFLLENTPIIPGFNPLREKEKFERVKERYLSKRGIKTNSHRYLIVARKS